MATVWILKTHFQVSVFEVGEGHTVPRIKEVKYIVLG
jgi:hypothetical protein